MAVRIKKAQSAKELSDVYKLRYQVYNQEEGLFQHVTSGHILDLYDAIPNSFSVIAYSGDQAVGIIRGTADSELGFPSDHVFDFTDYRSRIEAEAKANGDKKPSFVNAGMLAITTDWRNRRDVFRGLLRMATDVAYSQGNTHIVATINDDTVGIYKRLGWDILSDKIWIEEVGKHVYAIGCAVDRMRNWAFNMLEAQESLLAHFAGCFEWEILDKGSTIFSQGSDGHEAYLITKGAVDISCQFSPSAPTLSLARLGEGDMFGELSLIDETPRSATAITQANTELLVISREAFWQKVEENPKFLRDLMGILSSRLRSADHRALLYAHASTEERLGYFVDYATSKTKVDINDATRKISKITLKEYAALSVVSEAEATAFLQSFKGPETILVEDQKIIFATS